MTFSLSDQTLEIPCPKCRRKTKKSIGWIKANSKLACTCGVSITLDKSQLMREIAAVEKSVNDFAKSFR